jgi:hypothetical protein
MKKRSFAKNLMKNEQQCGHKNVKAITVINEDKMLHKNENVLILVKVDEDESCSTEIKISDKSESFICC